MVPESLSFKFAEEFFETPEKPLLCSVLVLPILLALISIVLLSLVDMVRYTAWAIKRERK